MSSHFHSASQSRVDPTLSANCTYNLRLFRLVCGDILGMYKSSSARCNVFYSNGVKGEPSPTWLTKYRGEDEEAVTRTAIKELKIFVS